MACTGIGNAVMPKTAIRRNRTKMNWCVFTPGKLAAEKTYRAKRGNGPGPSAVRIR